MPKTANGNVLDWNIRQSGALVLEVKRQLRWLPRPGTLHLLGFRNATKAPAYADATRQLQAGTHPTNPDYILTSNGYGGVKYGFGLNIEQPIGLTKDFFAG